MNLTKIFCVFLIMGLVLGQLSLLKGQTSTLKIQPANVDRQLTMPWRNCIAVGRANNLLRADILEHLAYAQNIMGYRYCRFHSIFDAQKAVVHHE